MKPVSAILLAGGYSSRMGKDKAELDFRGHTLLEHQAEKLRSLGITDILISGYENARGGTRFVPDVYPHRGPMSGIHAGLCAAQNDHALVLAVDTPLVPKALLLELIEAHRSGITLAEAEGRIEPLIGVYDKALSRACRQLLQGDSVSLHRLFEKADVHALGYQGDPRLLVNCNTPEEYRLALSLRQAEASANSQGQ